MSCDNVQGGKVTNAVIAPPVSKQIDDEFRRFEYQDHQLLPGILDEITLDHIVPKMPWRTFHILSSVSRGWKQVIQCRQIYDARVRSQSTKTLVLINHFRSGNGRVIGLHSMEDNSFYQLPAIPNQKRGIPRSCQCIALDGKIYILGGVEDETLDRPSGKVYVMDLAGQMQWELCASMTYPRKNFGCGVRDGKIYISGGSFYMKPVPVPEVYDPKLDVWTPMQSMRSMRKYHHVTALGEELLIHGGRMFNPSYFASTKHPIRQCPRTDYVLDADFLELYHPVRDDWRQMGPLGRCKEDVFVAQGKIHSMNKCSIHVYDPDRNSWTQRHSFSLPASGGVEGDLSTTLAVDNELVTIVSRRSYYGRTVGQLLLRSVGFGSREEKITWQTAKCSFEIGCNPFLCAIQL